MPPPEIERSVWAVRTAARTVPRATCLVQSLAGRALLERQGRSCRLHLGVKKPEDKPFAAHAWLECEGRIVLGDAEADGFTPLRVRESSRP